MLIEAKGIQSIEARKSRIVHPAEEPTEFMCLNTDGIAPKKFTLMNAIVHQRLTNGAMPVKDEDRRPNLVPLSRFVRIAPA